MVLGLPGWAAAWWARALCWPVSEGPAPPAQEAAGSWRRPPLAVGLFPSAVSPRPVSGEGGLLGLDVLAEGVGGLVELDPHAFLTCKDKGWLSLRQRRHPPAPEPEPAPRLPSAAALCGDTRSLSSRPLRAGAPSTQRAGMSPVSQQPPGPLHNKVSAPQSRRRRENTQETSER